MIRSGIEKKRSAQISQKESGNPMNTDDRPKVGRMAEADELFARAHQPPEPIGEREALRELYDVVLESMGTGGWTPTALHHSLVHAMQHAKDALSREALPVAEPLGKLKLALDAKVVLEHYNEVIAVIPPPHWAETDFVMTVDDYRVLHDLIVTREPVALSNAPPDPSNAPDPSYVASEIQGQDQESNLTESPGEAVQRPTP